MQIVHILRAEKESVAQLRLQAPPAQRAPDSAAPSPLPRAAPSKTAHTRAGFALPRIRRAHILNTIARPQPVCRAKRRQPALRADARAGQHKHPIFGAIEILHGLSIQL